MLDAFPICIFVVGLANGSCGQCIVPRPGQPFIPMPVVASPERARGSTDDLIAHLLAKDADGDGKLVADELGERLAAYISPGDINGDAALDISELAQLVERAERPQAVRGRAFRVNGSMRPTLKRGTEGVLDDLKVPWPRRSTALAILADHDQAATRARDASVAQFMSEVRRVLSNEQMLALTAFLQREPPSPATVLITPSGPVVTSATPLSLRREFEAALESLGLTAVARVHFDAALHEHINQIISITTNIAPLKVRLRQVLTKTEFQDFEAAYERQRSSVFVIAGMIVRVTGDGVVPDLPCP